MWDLPGPGLEPVSPALAGRFLTTVPPRKSKIFYFSNFILFFILCYCSAPFGLLPPSFSFFCWGFVLRCCNCFNYIFIFPNIFFIFLILFRFLFFVIVLPLFFFFLFLFFLWHCAACRILVPRMEVGPELLWLELQVQTTGLIKNPRPQGIAIRVRPPGCPHLGTNTRLYPTACKLKCWTPQTKQPVRQEYSPTHQKKKKQRNYKRICYRRGSNVKTYKTK